MSDFIPAARRAEKLMRSLFAPTPLQRNDHLSAEYEADIWLKREDLSPVRSYKIRGALNAISKVLARDPDTKVFVCASAGNHAQGVAYVCRHFGVKGVIFMPVTTPKQKIEKTRMFGGENIEIRLTGDYFDDTLSDAQSFCAHSGGYFLSPFDDVDVIEGQSSVAEEIMMQMGHAPDMIVLPVGGGGLSAGVTQYFNASQDQVDFRYIEPAGAANLKAALEA
jgi:threonine dehydratase